MGTDANKLLEIKAELADHITLQADDTDPPHESWTIVLGLLLSAAAPWLLTALFLKAKPQRPDEGDLAVAE